MNVLFLFLYGFKKCRKNSYLFLFLFEFSAHSVMSSGFEVRALTMDRNRLKRLRTNEDEEIFTIQVSKSVFSMHDKNKSGNAHSYIRQLLAFEVEYWVRV